LWMPAAVIWCVAGYCCGVVAFPFIYCHLVRIRSFSSSEDAFVDTFCRGIVVRFSRESVLMKSPAEMMVICGNLENEDLLGRKGFASSKRLHTWLDLRCPPCPRAERKRDSDVTLRYVRPLACRVFFSPSGCPKGTLRGVDSQAAAGSGCYTVSFAHFSTFFLHK